MQKTRIWLATLDHVSVQDPCHVQDLADLVAGVDFWERAQKGLWFGLPQHLLNLWTVETCEEDEPTDPKQQLLHDIEQQDIQKDPQWEPIISSVAGARGLKPDQ